MQTLIFFPPLLPLSCEDSSSFIIPPTFWGAASIFPRRSGAPWRGLPLDTFSGNQKIMCAHCSQIMSLLAAVKDMVAVETQDLDPPGLYAKPGTCIFLQAAGGLGVLGGERRLSLEVVLWSSTPAPPLEGGCLL